MAIPKGFQEARRRARTSARSVRKVHEHVRTDAQRTRVLKGEGYRTIHRADISKQKFRALLFRWFDQMGRKNLPWQQEKTPYRVWISEVMLQQTQVQTVIPYFTKFLKQFEDVRALAEAKEEEVLKFWAGLGYYSRARSLHRAAKIVMEKHGGHLPNNLQDLQALSGIGRSTAGAILSIAFGKPTPILDGNVKRFFIRLFGIREDANHPKTLKTLWDLSEQYMGLKRSADFTQAMMDVGATLCTRTKPRCDQCPFKSYCKAYQQNIVLELPKRLSKKPNPKRDVTLLIFMHQGRILLEKRASKGIWGGLFSFPELAGRATRAKILDVCRNLPGISVAQTKKLPAILHAFTHFRLTMHPILLGLSKAQNPLLSKTPKIWYKIDSQKPLALAAPIQKLIHRLRTQVKYI